MFAIGVPSGPGMVAPAIGALSPRPRGREEDGSKRFCRQATGRVDRFPVRITVFAHGVSPWQQQAASAQDGPTYEE